jgi:hypothetical protein
LALAGEGLKALFARERTGRPFRDRCKQKAVGTDDLSLLAGITEDERIRYLRKHKRSVVRFLEAVASANFLSSLANKYKKRFQKSGEKMFTFLDHDGVPWNNNNAEHAIKRFAKYRRDADGRFTERSLQEYLVLATVLETCEFNNLNVLKFLLSKETTLEGLLRMARHKARDLKSSVTPHC